MPTLISDATRLSDVSKVLMRHGLDYVVHHASLKQPFWHKFVTPRTPSAQTLPQEVRGTLEDLGGGYIKLGQLLSVRPDIIPSEFCDEFKKLQDNVPAFPASVARQIITAELGKPVNELFSQFEDVPIGSASIAQVHRARLAAGQHVVIKVQRPDAATTYFRDIDIMHRIAENLERHDVLTEYEPTMLVDEFERSTRKELDFRHEALTIRRFEQLFHSSRTITIPHVTHATKSVIVMTELRGKKLSELGTTTAHRDVIIANLVDAMIDQIFRYSIFHADLHPGNIMILPGDRIGLMDFGITGTLTAQMRKHGIAMYSAVAGGDSEAAVQALRAASTSDTIDMPALSRDIHDLFLEWQDAEHHLPSITFHRMFRSAKKHGVQLPPELVLVGKALVTLEGTCQTLDPSFNLIDYGYKHFQHIRSKELREAFSPAKLRSGARRAIQSLSQFSDDTLAIMDRIKRGTVQVDIDDTDIRHLGRDMNTSSNRLAFALVISSLLVFSALVIKTEPLVEGVSIYSVAGLALAFLTVMLLIVSIRREGRKGIDTHNK